MKTLTLIITAFTLSVTGTHACDGQAHLIEVQAEDDCPANTISVDRHGDAVWCTTLDEVEEPAR